MTTTPDYAGLITRLDAVKHGSDRPYAASIAADAIQIIRALLESNAALERERDEWKSQIERVTDPVYLDEKLKQIGVYDLERRAEAAEARVKELEAQISYSKNTERAASSMLNEWMQRTKCAEAEIARLKERLAEADRVIEPFALVAEELSGAFSDDDVLSNIAGRRQLTSGDFRAARAYRHKGSTAHD